mmetsp:Transcript_2412/g.5224  ORF Transcript_2412/g.5224 Transcript_2412/m.5224 type:complete len:349 (+) Transcript_2412:64-1110(+)|eukprot:CAMPEP_0171344334 /NCGR_PEP_ID=MMETSP0878-20121228/19144_1 /TAXON_ID=67004 /ORGANISM="Thalassiosira weissflogii, Strain CCMP1336" /LENGTH=348 /DNA_ID=CAMNT_0011847497 /DNA_START=41 /DNA_END=1087 /DNA_ORIENTATION=+
MSSEPTNTKQHPTSMDKATAIKDNENGNKTPPQSRASEGDKTDFPGLLHKIVSDPATDYCIHWLPCGTHFYISDKSKFADEVLPIYYKHTKFPSFIRRLKRWGFMRVPSGPLMGAYYNPDFKRGLAARASLVKYNNHSFLSSEAIRADNVRAMAALVRVASTGGQGQAGMVDASLFSGPSTISGIGMNSYASSGNIGMNPGTAMGLNNNYQSALMQSQSRGMQLHSPSLLSANSGSVAKLIPLNHGLGYDTCYGGGYGPNNFPAPNLRNNLVPSLGNMPQSSRGSLTSHFLSRQAEEEEQLFQQLKFRRTMRRLANNPMPLSQLVPTSGMPESIGDYKDQPRSDYQPL